MIFNFIIFLLFVLVPILHCFAFIIGKGSSLHGYLKSYKYIKNIRSEGQVKSIDILIVILFLCIFIYFVVRGNYLFELIEYFIKKNSSDFTNGDLDIAYSNIKIYEGEINRKISFIQFAIIASFALFIPTLLTIYANFKKDVFGLYEKFFIIKTDEKYKKIKYEVLEDSKLIALDNKIKTLNSINHHILKIGRWGVSIYLLSIFLFFVPSNIGVTNSIANFKKIEFKDSIKKLEDKIKYYSNDTNVNAKKVYLEAIVKLKNLNVAKQDYQSKLNALVFKTKTSYFSLSLSSTAIQTFIFLGLSLILLCLILFFPFYNNIYVWNNSISETIVTDKKKTKINNKIKNRIKIMHLFDTIFKKILPIIGPIILSLFLYNFISIIFYLNEDYKDSIFSVVCILFLLLGVMSYFSYIFFKSKFNNILFLGSFLIFQYIFNDYFIQGFEYKYIHYNILFIGIISDLYYLFKSFSFKVIIYSIIIPLNIVVFCLMFETNDLSIWGEFFYASFFVLFFIIGRIFINKFFETEKYSKRFDNLCPSKNSWFYKRKKI